MKYKDLVKKVEELEKIVKGTQDKIEKITLEQFFGSEVPLAIHCDTKEEAKTLLKAFDDYGKKWWNDDSYMEINNWEVYNNETCYTNKGCYADVDCYEGWIKIYEFEDVILPKPPKWTFTEDEKVILRNITKEFNWIARDNSGDLYIYDIKPTKRECAWGFTYKCDSLRVFNHLFQTIKWQDNEPCEFRKYI